jgi:hypothetical protein
MLIALFICGCAGKPDKATEQKGGEANAVTEQPKKAEAPPAIPAESLVAEFLKNKEEASKKYKAKKVVVEGVVVKKRVNDPDGPDGLYLKGGKGEDGVPVTVNCFFSALNEDRLKKVKEGDKVMARGIFSNWYGSYIVINGCEMLPEE